MTRKHEKASGKTKQNEKYTMKKKNLEGTQKDHINNSGKPPETKGEKSSFLPFFFNFEHWRLHTWKDRTGGRR